MLMVFQLCMHGGQSSDEVPQVNYYLMSVPLKSFDTCIYPNVMDGHGNSPYERIQLIRTCPDVLTGKLTHMTPCKCEAIMFCVSVFSSLPLLVCVLCIC